MTFTQLFAIYYSLFRAEADEPAITDPEFLLAIDLYNDALMRLAAMDDTKWNFLYTTLQSSTQVSPVLVRTLATGTSTYTAPTDMAEPGGLVTFVDGNDNKLDYSVVQPHEAQAINDESQYGYFTGDQNNGFVLNLGVAPTTAENGYDLDYVYYKKPTRLTSSETGTSVIAGGDPAYFYNHMLAQRFRAAENFPSYQTALRDSEEALKGMKLKNNSGNFYNQWGLLDTSGSSWGN